MTTTRSPRSWRVLMAAGAIAVAGVVAPVTAAQASTNPVDLSVVAGSSWNIPVGHLTGSITAVQGSTSASYSIRLCGQSTYQNSKVTIKAGNGSVTHSVSYQDCKNFTGTVKSTTAFATATVNLTGGTMNGNVYQERTNTRTIRFTGGSMPAVSTTPVTSPFEAAVRGSSRSLGLATGTITAIRGGTTATYSVRLCGQSTYTGSTVTIVAGNAKVTHSVSYQNCSTFTGRLTSTTPIYNATIAATGSTFNGSRYVTYTDNEIVYFD